MAVTPQVDRPDGAAPARLGHRRAWIVALAADFVQIIAMPLFFAGAVSPADDLLDVIVAVVMIRLLGWHFVFLPAFVAELFPGVNLAPTWTLAVFIATRTPRGRETREPSRAEVVEDRPHELGPGEPRE